MAHAFDTGLLKPFRTIVVEGAIAALSGLLRANGGYLANVKAYGGVVRTWTDVDGVALLAQSLESQAPAIAIAVGGRDIKPAGQGGFSTQSELEVLVYHVNNNAHDLAIGRLMSDAAGLAVDTRDPGIFVAMEHAEELLVGQRFGNTAMIKQVKPDREDELVTRENLTIWLQSYRVLVTRTVNQYRGVTQMLESIAVRTTQADDEVNLPDPPTSPTTIDAIGEDLPT